MQTTNWSLILCGALAIGLAQTSYAFKPNEAGHLGISSKALTDASVTRVVDGAPAA